MDPELSANGDILVPATHDDGSQTAVRLEPGDEGHAAWLEFIQSQRGPDGSDNLVAWGLLAALIMPIFGVAFGIMVLARGRGSQGAAVIVCSVAAVGVWVFTLAP